jgi:hypothetical protein
VTKSELLSLFVTSEKNYILLTPTQAKPLQRRRRAQPEGAATAVWVQQEGAIGAARADAAPAAT